MTHAKAAEKLAQKIASGLAKKERRKAIAKWCEHMKAFTQGAK